MKFILIIFSVLISSLLFAQTIEIKNVIGEGILSGNTSPNEARLEALNNAKLNALRKAGIEENINSYQLLYSNQKENEFSQFFTSDIQIELKGVVKSYQILSEETLKNKQNELVVKVIINAEVVKYETQPDFKYNVNVTGVKSAYNKNDNLTFEITVTQDSYLQIFNITDTEVYLFYPNPYEKQTLIGANNKLSFPISNIEYQLSTEKKTETNRLIFVFTKQIIPYIKMDSNQITSQEDVFSWIYSLPPDVRKVEYKTFILE